MDLLLGRTTTSLGLMLSVFLSVAVVAYRNDLSTNRHGCVWSTMEKEAIPTPSIASSSPGPYISGLLINPPHQQHGLPGGGGGGGGLLNCNLRTLNVDFWNYTFNRDQIDQTRVVRIKCSDKLFFESVLTPNQTLFQLRNLKEVQIESCKIRKIPKRVWASLTKLKSLTIRTQNTEWRASSAGLEVEQGSFEGLGQLEYLSLAENNLWSLGESKNALCPLRNLVHLNVSYNRLSDIEELISASPQVGASRSESGENLCALNVQNVDVSHNHIRRVGHNAFSNFPRMSELRLQNNLISELEDTAFTGLGQIKLLNLSSNRIVALPPTIFQSNLNIREIFLQNNTISAISSRVFSGLENLLSLDLSRNTLTSQWIKEDIFQGLSRLVILKLSSNQLSYVDGSIFKDLISLQSLSLERNKIDTIHPTAFNSLRNLHFLDLSFNRLSHIDSRVFSNLVVLSQLTLDHNKIRSLEDNALKNCSSISDLILSNNRLLNVPVAIKSLSYLKTLDIGENLITQVNNASFTGMVQLIGLRMVDNRIESLPSGFCSSMKKLRVLNLSQNKIREISSSAFISCPELRVLRLDTNSLQELPPTLAPQLPSLLWLNVSENQIRSADYRLLPPSTEWLDLSYNVIETLGPISRVGNVTHDQRSSSLRVMDISYNRLKSLDQSGIPPSLETLRINHNSQFKTVEPNTFLASTQLRRVELIGNQIEILPLESLQLPQIPSGRMLPDFYLANNPFTQNCQMEWLTRTHQLTVLRTHPHIVDLDAILLRPTFPRPNQVVSLMDTRPQDFLCPYKSHCFALCHCCEFEFCDCEMSCPDNCTCYHDNSWSSNIVVCSNLQYENVPAKIPMDSSELYLDGNNISQLGSHIFIGKKNLLSLYLNGSNVESIKNKTFNGLKALQTLNLQDNFLSELNGYEFADLENIREIYLQNNEIVTVHKDTFANLKFLQVLRIDGNLIIDFNVWELSANGYLNSVMLANNPWNCDCDFLIPFRNWVASKTTIVADFSLATCQIYYAEDEDHQHDGVIATMSKFPATANHQLQPTISSMCNFASNADITFNYDQNGNNELLEINNHISSMGGAAEKVAGPVGLPPPSENHSNFSRLDTNSADNTFWALLLCLSAFLIVILVILAIFRQEIYYWARNALLNGGESSGFLANLLNCCCCCPEKYSGTHHPGGAGGKNLCPSTMLDDQEKLFDAYFLYAKRDEDMLIQKIVPELEDPTTASTTPGHKFRLCLHYRDLCLSPESPWNREMILSACDASKRVVLVLSNTFLQSEWSSSIHFRTSIQSAIALHPKKLVFILLPDFNQNMSSISSELSNYSSTNTIKNSCVSWADKNFWTKFKRLLPKPSSPIPHCLLGGENGSNLQNEIYNNSCDPSQLPYNLVMNPNLAQLHHLQQLQQQQQHQQTLRSNHYHSNLLPYQIPVPNGMMSRNNSLLPPVPKHQIVLPALPANSNNNGLHQHNHNAIISSSTTNNSLIHPIPSQLTPQAFGYSNETFHLQQNNHHQNFVNHHHPNNNHNQPIHFSSPQQNPHHQHPLHQQMHPVIIPPHSHHHHQHLHTPSQVSTNSNNFSTSLLYPHHHQQTTTRGDDQPNYSSSAVSSCAEFDHVYSTLDSPLQSPGLLTSDRVDYSPNGGGPTNNTVDSRNSSKHTVQHSTSSGVSSGSDMTCGGESSSAVSPSSPIKNGILNKLNAHMNSNNNPGGSSNTNQNGKMYFV